jgi:3-isopropylmalate/(R)-2-methylmalate dehydratase large subunit
MTGAQKILAQASGKDHVAIGDVVYPRPELVIVHDGYVETAFKELVGLGYGALRDPGRTVFVTDHEVAYGSQRALGRGKAIRAIAAHWKVGHFFDAGRGGHGHIFPMEAGLVRPGMFLFAYDMHCTNFGAVGALAMGVGAEITAVLASGSLWTQVPQTLRVDLEGKFAPGCHARDAGFLLTGGLVQGRWQAEYDYRVIEFGGSGLPALALSDRVALCNSVTEIGVVSVLFAGAVPGLTSAADAAAFSSDEDAPFESRITLDLAGIQPQVALPGGPELAASVESVAGTPVQHAFLGSCGSGMYEDFVAAAAAMRGRAVAEGVRLFVVPGTQATARRLADEGVMQQFMDAGAIVLPPGCGPCAGGLMAPLGAGETSISTAATNHEGRFGPPEGQAYLGSPLTVAASAVAGRITDPRALRAGA